MNHTLSEESDISAYFPLQLGATWAYTHTVNPNQQDESVYEGTNTIIEKVTLGNTDWYQFSTSPDSLFADVEQLEFAIINNELNMRFLDGKETVQFTLLKSPVTAGTSWTEFGGALFLEIQSTNADISIPSGNYNNVIKLRFFIPDDEEDFIYFANGVGMIKFTYNAFNQGQQPQDSPIDESWELTRYSE